MSKAKRQLQQRTQEFDNWSGGARIWAYDTARHLAVDLAVKRAGCTKDYTTGVVLKEHELVLAIVPAQFEWEADWSRTETTFRTGYYGPMSTSSSEVTNRSWRTDPMTDWVVTNQRMIARNKSGELVPVEWAAITGVVVDLPNDLVVVDCEDGRRRSWSGPAASVIAVAAIAILHGPLALIDHPAVAALRVPQALPGRAARRM